MIYVKRHAFAVIASVVITLVLHVGDLNMRLKHWSIDFGHWISHLLPEQPTSDLAPAVIIGFDEATYLRQPFAGTPRVLWTPQIGEIFQAVLDSGALGIGLDVVFPTSPTKFVANKQYEKPYIQALRRGRKEGSVVIGALDIGGEKSLVPTPLQTWAVGKPNIRSLNVTLDSDAIIRSVPRDVPLRDRDNRIRLEKAFAAEIANRYQNSWRRGIKAKPTPLPPTPQSWLFERQDDLILRFPTRQDSFPAYSFVDIWHCYKNGNVDYLKRHFDGKIVLFGTLLNTEDRKITSGRLISDHLQGNTAPRCTGSATPAPSTPSDLTQTISGIFVQATVIDNILNNRDLQLAHQYVGYTMTLLISVLGALAISIFALPTALATCAGLLCLVSLSFVVNFESSLVLPFLLPSLALGLTVMAVYPYRTFVSEKSGRSLKKVFANYVSPNLAEEIMADPDAVGPGGTRREATFLFTDLENFTNMVESNDPEETLEELNHYMGGMIRIALDHGGTIDKIIGDALVCMFGAPVAQEDHAERATRCALALDEYAQQFRQRPQAKKLGFMRTRIGINTGEAIIGNNGGDIFFDYTGLGDVVNTAARLEGINKYLDTRICISGSTHEQCPDILARETGKVQLKGKKELVQTFEPLTENDRDSDWLTTYRDAFSALDRGDTASAKELFEKASELRGGDPICAYHLQRLQDGAKDTVIVFDSK